MPGLILLSVMFFYVGMYICQKKNFLCFLAESAVMHLNFDKLKPVKPGAQTVDDESGNKNDAGLVNGAEISNRTMGIVKVPLFKLVENKATLYSKTKK